MNNYYKLFVYFTFILPLSFYLLIYILYFEIINISIYIYLIMFYKDYHKFYFFHAFDAIGELFSLLLNPYGH